VDFPRAAEPAAIAAFSLPVALSLREYAGVRPRPVALSAGAVFVPHLDLLFELFVLDDHSAFQISPANGVSRCRLFWVLDSDANGGSLRR
jgi:hypothetical protein